MGPVTLVAWPEEGQEAVLLGKAASRQLSLLGFGESANLPLGPHLCHQTMGQGRGGMSGRQGEQVRRVGWVGWPLPRVTCMSKALSQPGPSGILLTRSVTRATAMCKVEER